MKKKPVLALKFIELRDELQDICEEIASEINRGNAELALLMLGRDKAEQVGKRVPGPEGTEVMQAVVTLVEARFDLEEAI
jgi:GGDEF domain-containing protein